MIKSQAEITQMAFITARNNYLNNIHLVELGGGRIRNNQELNHPYNLTLREYRNLKMLINKLLTLAKGSEELAEYYDKVQELIVSYRDYDDTSIRDGIIILTALTHVNQMREYGTLPHNTIH